MRRRRLALLAAVVVALVAAIVVVVLGRLDAIVRRTIEQRGSALTQTAVRLGSVHVSLQEGTATLRGLTIANPPGFQAPNAFELSEITVQIALDSVTSDPLVIREIRITGPRVTCELNKEGMSNVEVIRSAVEAQHQRGSGGGAPAPEGQPAPPAGKDESSGGRRLIIDLLTLHDGEVYVDARAVGGPAQSEKLPGFELTDIGRQQGGATPNEVGRIVVTALARDVAVAVAATQLERWIGKEVGGPAGDLIKKSGAEAIRKGLGGVLDQILRKNR